MESLASAKAVRAWEEDQFLAVSDAPAVVVVEAGLELVLLFLISLPSFHWSTTIILSNIRGRGLGGGRPSARARGAGGPRGKKPQVSSADLDAEMDAYHAKNKTDAE